MARIITQLIVVLFFVAGSALSQTWSADVVDEESLGAFKTYWSAFDAYERQSVQSGQKKYQQAWENAKTEYQKERKKIAVQELSALYKASEKYKKHLLKHPEAENRPFVLLNLAQVLNLIGDQLQNDDANASTFAKSEALAILNELLQAYRDFADREKALYVRALVLVSLDRPDEALAAWRVLAKEGTKTIYGVHGHVAVGDYWFDRDNAASALTAYQNGRHALERIEFPQKEYEIVRLNYRIAWAAYRAGELSQVIDAAVALLSPGQAVESLDKRAKFQLDAVDLLGDALYENNALADTKRVLNRKEIFRFAPAAGLKAVRRYNTQGIHNEAVNVGKYLVEAFPLAAEAPDIIVTVADSYEKLGKQHERISFLEKLAVFLPERSLWRAQHKDEYDAIKRMELLASKAAAVAADWHYERGRTTGNSRASMAGAALYEILIAFAPNGDESSKWRLRMADCHFSAGKLAEASMMYRNLKTGFKVDQETLQAAAYELVRVDEKKWREEYSRALANGHQPKERDKVVKALADLEQSIDEYATRFPQEKRSIDLLLVGASANRDMEKYEDASRYWQRALVSQPDPAQRGVAIRGLVLSSLKLGSAGDVVEVTRRFLKLEDWRALGLNIGDELKGVLAVAALDEGKRLNDSGRVREAGSMLTEIAKEYGDIPNRDRIFRDGAYMLAIAGDWSSAKSAAEQYLDTNLEENRGDMIYLLARSQHYQLRLAEAAQAYLQVGEKFPKHARALISLQRAESLAKAEGLHSLAAQAASALAESAQTTKDRMLHYASAVQHLDEAQDPEQALSIARKRLRTAKTAGEKFDAALMVALATYRMGSSYEQEALDDLAVLAKNLERGRDQLKDDEYAELAGQIYFHLAEEDRRRFDDFRIATRSGSESANVTAKMRFFEEMAASYDRSAAAGSALWSPRSRYLLASSAEQFADEVAALDAKKTGAKQYRTTAERLRALAKKYYSTNVLVSKREPHKFNDNEWVQKSESRLAAFDNSKTASEYTEILPPASNPDLPSAWSL